MTLDRKKIVIVILVIIVGLFLLGMIRSIFDARTSENNVFSRLDSLSLQEYEVMPHAPRLSNSEIILGYVQSKLPILNLWGAEAQWDPDSEYYIERIYVTDQSPAETCAEIVSKIKEQILGNCSNRAYLDAGNQYISESELKYTNQSEDSYYLMLANRGNTSGSVSIETSLVLQNGEVYDYEPSDRQQPVIAKYLKEGAKILTSVEVFIDTCLDRNARGAGC